MPLAFTTGTSSHPKNTLQKRKFDIKVLLLFHVLIPGVMLSSLETINPWLSACDLKQQSPSDLKGSCSATQFPTRTTPPPDVELLCPKECPPNESKTNASCLAYLDDARRSAICNFNLGNGIEWLKSFLGTIRLRHCCEYKIIESLSQSLLERVLRGKDECFRIIDSLVDVDNLAARVTCEFSEILSRYDCGQPYSVKFSCNDCLEAYRRWVCSTLVPYFNESARIRPCRSVCQSVEQKCPYFLPENKAPALPTQYAGEPTFLCMDPNIPETGEQQKRSLYPDKSACCVKICGSLKDGLCVERGDSGGGCRSEDLITYEEALDQGAECGGADAPGSRVPSLECTASEPYSSPHKLGSGGGSGPRPGPGLVLTACLNHWTWTWTRSAAPGRFRHLVTLVVVVVVAAATATATATAATGLQQHSSYAFPMIIIMKILACLIVAFADLSRIKSLLLPLLLLLLLSARVRERLKNVFFHTVKRSKLIFNYFKFNSNKWQYYFILISVNLLFNSSVKTPKPLTTPLSNGFQIGKTRVKTRRARRYIYYYYYYHYYYYYFYYYYYYNCYYYYHNYYYHYCNCNYYYYYYCYYRYKHYYTILWRIAQNSSNGLSWVSRDESVRPPSPIPVTGTRDGDGVCDDDDVEEDAAAVTDSTPAAAAAVAAATTTTINNNVVRVIKVKTKNSYSVTADSFKSYSDAFVAIKLVVVVASAVAAVRQRRRRRQRQRRKFEEAPLAVAEASAAVIGAAVATTRTKMAVTLCDGFRAAADASVPKLLNWISAVTSSSESSSLLFLFLLLPLLLLWLLQVSNECEFQTFRAEPPDIRKNVKIKKMEKE